jgi:hypothetical protein
MSIHITNLNSVLSLKGDEKDFWSTNTMDLISSIINEIDYLESHTADTGIWYYLISYYKDPVINLEKSMNLKFPLSFYRYVNVVLYVNNHLKDNDPKIFEILDKGFNLGHVKCAVTKMDSYNFTNSNIEIVASSKDMFLADIQKLKNLDYMKRLDTSDITRISNIYELINDIFDNQYLEEEISFNFEYTEIPTTHVDYQLYIKLVEYTKLKLGLKHINTV